MVSSLVGTWSWLWMVMKAKPRGNRRTGRKVTYGNDWKKAVVTLTANDKIELFEGV